MKRLLNINEINRQISSSVQKMSKKRKLEQHKIKVISRYIFIYLYQIKTSWVGPQNFGSTTLSLHLFSNFINYVIKNIKLVKQIQFYFKNILKHLEFF